METMKELSPELRIALEEWAERSLEGIGLYKKDSPEYRRLMAQTIRQLRCIYSDKAIDLFLRGRDNRRIETPDGYAQVEGECGDVMEIFLRIDNDRIVDSSFQTSGCAPSVASGGMVAEMVRGKTIDEIKMLNQRDVLDSLGGLPEESQHCAMLAVYTLKDAIEDYYKKG
ncbi:MAG: iron-sulfur cluster assembly scaffold protein [Spirochaetes bacterium]|nr:iron-sulfur cluster assembly scaffold protein [Spirochaetota bacterium]